MALFEGFIIRSVWDESLQKYWFSVVDICAALTSSDYQTARNYWKWFKHKLNRQGNPLVTSGCGTERVLVSKQVQFPAQDGKLRYTDVLDAEGVFQLIQLCPSPKADAFRRWLNEFVNDMTKAVKLLTEAITKAKDGMKDRVGRFFRIVERRSIDISAARIEAPEVIVIQKECKALYAA